MSDDDERALSALADAVAFVTTVVQRRAARRDALIATPDPGLHNLATRIASAFGFHIFHTADTAEAAATAAGRPFDLILLDADAPKDMLRATHRIRALPDRLGAAPIVALRADLDRAWREAAADIGVDAFVPAPVSAARLVDVIALLMGAQDGAGEERREA